MERTEYKLKSRSEYIVKKEAEFKCEITGEVHTLKDVYNKFKDYRFEEHLDNFREEFNCQAKCHITYYLIISYKRRGIYFRRFLVSSLGIPNRNETDFLAIPSYDERGNPKEEVNDILRNKSYDRVCVEATMEITFLLLCSLDTLTEYEAEQLEDLHDEGDDDEGYQDNPSDSPAIIETCFISDNCSACLSEKPNILNIPCLHLSICNKCEEVGKLIRCLVCREKIERKIKI